MGTIDKSKLHIFVISEKYPKEKLESFNCADNPEEEEINKFLVEDAQKYQDLMFSRVYLCEYEDKLVAYLTLSTDSIRFDDKTREKFKEMGINIVEFPALKVGRLGVINTMKKKGIGELLMGHVKAKVWFLNQDTAGCRFITVDAKQGAVGFYETLGFKRLEKKKDKNPTMWYDVGKFIEGIPSKESLFSYFYKK